MISRKFLPLSKSIKSMFGNVLFHLYFYKSLSTIKRNERSVWKWRILSLFNMRIFSPTEQIFVRRQLDRRERRRLQEFVLEFVAEKSDVAHVQKWKRFVRSGHERTARQRRLAHAATRQRKGGSAYSISFLTKGITVTISPNTTIGWYLDVSITAGNCSPFRKKKKNTLHMKWIHKVNTYLNKKIKEMF